MPRTTSRGSPTRRVAAATPGREAVPRRRDRSGPRGGRPGHRASPVVVSPVVVSSGRVSSSSGHPTAHQRSGRPRSSAPCGTRRRAARTRPAGGPARGARRAVRRGRPGAPTRRVRPPSPADRWGRGRHGRRAPAARGRDDVLGPVAEHRSELPDVLPEAPQVVGEDDGVHARVLDDGVTARSSACCTRVRRAGSTTGPTRTTDATTSGCRSAASTTTCGPHRLPDEHQVTGAARPDRPTTRSPSSSNVTVRPTGSPRRSRQVDGDRAVGARDDPLRPGEGPVRHADAVHEHDRRCQRVAQTTGGCQGPEPHGQPPISMDSPVRARCEPTGGPQRGISLDAACPAALCSAACAR